MKGTLTIQTKGGRKASIEVDVTPKGVNTFELAAQKQRLKVELGLDEYPGCPHECFLLLPSKMNYSGFVVEGFEPIS